MTAQYYETDQIEVVLALPSRCHRVSIEATSAMTVAAAVAASGLDRVCFETTGQWPSAYATHGRRINGNAAASGNARIELLRPLEIDPKTARRDRATRARQGRAED